MYTSIRELRTLFYDFKKRHLTYNKIEDLTNLLSKLIDKVEELEGRLEELEELIK